MPYRTPGQHPASHGKRWAVLGDEGEAVSDIAATFAVSETPSGTIARVGGHLFLLAEGRDVLTAPDRWGLRVPDPRPGETAFVLARPGPDAPWFYLGVGRWRVDESAWSFEAPSFGVWHQLSSGRGASRTLEPAWLAAAGRLAELAATTLQGVGIARGGQRGNIVGRAAQGGLRISGGDGGFSERTVSVLDLGWALAAERDVRAKGGVLDEARVNRLRYLDGTPKGATRWIDSGWALAVLGAHRSMSKES